MTGTPTIEPALVSVIIPAYNAEATIAETLESVAAQDHRRMEVIVVDDGSGDGTPAIVERIAAADPRFRLVSQANAGVAAARNRGAAEAKADLLAFVDADDLWAPDKLSRQIAALEAAGPKAGLSYCWYALIDAASTITYLIESEEITGPALDKLLLHNFIGNGSAALVRRRAFEDAGGFEPGLRAAGAQGCEDLLFYCRVAEHHDFAVVPDFLVGYRQLPDNMSSNVTRMLRSWKMVGAEMRTRHPESGRLIHQGLRRYARWVTRHCVHRRKPAMLLSTLAEIGRGAPGLAARMALVEAPRAAIEMVRPNTQPAPPAPEPLLANIGRFVVGTRYKSL